MFYEGPEEQPGALPPAFRLPGDIPLDRMAARTALLRTIDKAHDARHGSPLDAFQAQAVDILVNSEAAWRAFSFDDENPRTLARYGEHKFGKSCLAARRLVEAGVSLVMVSWPSETVHFDTHAAHFGTMRDDLLPHVDRGCAALLEDLSERGLLGETLVVVTGEFGRTPRINPNSPPGRDHWPYVYSVLLAGGGGAGGRVYGASDDIAGRPRDNPVHVRDLVATIYDHLGIPGDSTVTDMLGRPLSVVAGTPVEGLC
jgi:uncharacterized protein (DUF1501 family)